MLIFSKFGWNNLNSHNSKTHVIRKTFESLLGFELHEFSYMYHMLPVDTKPIKKHFWMKQFLNNSNVDLIASSKDKDKNYGDSP